jgi:hypothetical protein
MEIEAFFGFLFPLRSQISDYHSARHQDAFIPLFQQKIFPD